MNTELITKTLYLVVSTSSDSAMEAISAGRAEKPLIAAAGGIYGYNRKHWLITPGLFC